MGFLSFYQKRICAPYFAIFFEDCRQKETAEEGLRPVCAPVGQTVWDAAGSSPAFWRCFCLSCTLTVPRCSLTLLCLSWDIRHLCLSEKTKGKISIPPFLSCFCWHSRWCHKVMHLFAWFLIWRLFMFPSRTTHALLCIIIPIFPPF